MTKIVKENIFASNLAVRDKLNIKKKELQFVELLNSLRVYDQYDWKISP